MYFKGFKLLICFITFIFISIFQACNNKNKGNGLNKVYRNKLIFILTKVIKSKPFPLQLQANAIVKAQNQSQLFFKAMGEIEQINVSNNSIVKVGQILAIFELKNIGSNNMIISAIEPDCFCTIPKWNKAPVLPSKSKIVEVLVQKDYEGIFQQVVTVNCNTKEKKHLLVVRGYFKK